MTIQPSFGPARRPVPGRVRRHLGPLAGPVAARPATAREFQVWANDSLQLVRSLDIEGDSLRGIVTRPGHCQNCMIAMGLSEVDSVRSFRAVTGGTGSFLVGLGLGTVVVWFLLIRAIAAP